MDKPAIRKTATSSTIRGPRMRIAKGIRCAAWFAMVVFANLPVIAAAQQPCPGIHVQILNIRNSKGTVACALFESPEGFPTQYLHFATNIMMIKIRQSQARCDFEDIPPGTYAMAVVHDENMNGKLDSNFIGIPKEGYGFSNDAKASMGAPSFSAASFKYDGQNIEMTMKLHY